MVQRSRPEASKAKKETLGALLSPFERYPLECDGMTRVLSYVLAKAGVRHEVRVGAMSLNGRDPEIIPHHWWIVTPDDIYIDYRCRMWIKDREDAPHGVFTPDEFPNASYEGKAIPLSVSELEFNVLTSF